MKVTLEFDLPEDADALRAAQLGPAYRSALRAVRRSLRDKLKYDDKLRGPARAATQETYDLVLAETDDFGEDF